MTLKTAFDKLLAVDFPEFAESDELADWMADLAELDGHVAGIATSIISGIHFVDTSKLSLELYKLKKRLSMIDDIPEEDKLIYDECIRYLQVIEEVVLAFPA